MSKQGIVHIEIPAKSWDDASKFYQAAFGWDIEPMPQMNYATFESGTVAGGFNPLSEDNPVGAVMVYINSDNIGVDITRIEGLGGKLVQNEMEIPGYGSFAIFTDPTGNRMALYQAK